MPHGFASPQESAASTRSTVAAAVSAPGSRRHAESPGSGLTGFALDRHRVVHSAAFRRLEYKTQVFVTHEGDHFRTRLTHTLEVAAVARRLAAMLSLNEALAETIALAHDLGHPPFGHAGEAALHDMMQGHGGFEHNAQSLRVVDYLEHPYPDFRGLNLSFEVREGLIKHCTRYDRPEGAAAGEPHELYADGPMPALEAQVANLADEIAYTLHDIEDGLMMRLVGEAELDRCGLWREAIAPWRRTGDLPLAAVRRPVLDLLLDRLVLDATESTRRTLAGRGIDTLSAVRRSAEPLVGFSPPTRTEIEALQTLLRDTVYRHEQVQRMDAEARRIVSELFTAYLADVTRLPVRFAQRVGEHDAHRVICDYIAGMTDRYCRSEHARWAG